MLRETASLDLEAVPLYLLRYSELPEGVVVPADSDACYSPTLDLQLRPAISDWQGRGIGIALQDDLDEWQACGSVLHELAHYCQVSVICAAVDSVELLTHEPARMSARNRRAVQREHQQQRAVQPARPWDGHGLDFCWICCHLGYRAWQLADLRDSWQLLGFAGDAYALSHHSQYLQAAGETPAALLDLPLLTIASLQPPAGFCELFAADTATFEAR